jgi:thiamine-monophosphate kinase
MPPDALDERARIAALARRFGRPGLERAGVEVGIGDDAAVLRAPPAAASLVFTIDEQVEGQHFRRDLASFYDIGWRSFMAAASDVAAMGAIPWCALSALVLPDDVDDAALDDIARGQRDAADAIDAPIVGGNLARGPRGHGLSIATTLLGTCASPVRRSGARAGDGLWIAGRVGLAAAGWRALDRGLPASGHLVAAVDAWRRPRALVAEGRAMAAVANAAIDVSDGLARDAGHVAEASGVRLVLDASAILSDASLLAAAGALGGEGVACDDLALDLALHGGEDYALVVASDVPIHGFRRIGDVREGRGLALREAGEETTIEPTGFDHFRARP